MIDKEDEKSMRELAECAEFRVRPIPELLQLAYELGHLRGGVRTLESARDRLNKISKAA